MAVSIIANNSAMNGAAINPNSTAALPFLHEARRAHPLPAARPKSRGIMSIIAYHLALLGSATALRCRFGLHNG